MPNNALVGHWEVSTGHRGVRQPDTHAPARRHGGDPQWGDEPARILHYMNEELEVNTMTP
jgi:hypothetical protein